MKDSFGREITYLRLSVTDRCNLRCRYCMPSDGVRLLDHSAILTQEEMVSAVRACADLGISKVRITGGEPLVKKNIVSICSEVASVPGVEKLCMTTNGLLLGRYARELKAAGVSCLNISLDTLDAGKYAKITRIGSLSDYWKGFDSALEAGFDKIKINTVLVGGFNDDEIRDIAGLTLKYPVDVRFIELMGMNDDGFFNRMSAISSDRVLEVLPELEALPSKDSGSSVARMYHLPRALGDVGLISPLSHRFCSSCNRIRITADGKVKSCLHSADELNIKGLSFIEMEEVLKKAILSKPRCHNLGLDSLSLAGRSMNGIGG